MGRIAGNLEKKDLNEVFDRYAPHFYRAMSTPPKHTSHINVLMHGLGYFSRYLSSSEKKFFLDSLERYRQAKIPLSVPLHILKSYVVAFENEYLARQTFFEPYPEELVEISVHTVKEEVLALANAHALFGDEPPGNAAPVVAGADEGPRAEHDLEPRIAAQPYEGLEREVPLERELAAPWLMEEPRRDRRHCVEAGLFCGPDPVPPPIGREPGVFDQCGQHPVPAAIDGETLPCVRHAGHEKRLLWGTAEGLRRVRGGHPQQRRASIVVAGLRRFDRLVRSFPIEWASASKSHRSCVETSTMSLPLVAALNASTPR